MLVNDDELVNHCRMIRSMDLVRQQAPNDCFQSTMKVENVKMEGEDTMVEQEYYDYGSINDFVVQLNSMHHSPDETVKTLEKQLL